MPKLPGQQWISCTIPRACQQEQQSSSQRQMPISLVSLTQGAADMLLTLDALTFHFQDWAPVAAGRVRAAEIRPALDGLASELGADRGIVDDEWLSLTLEADEDKFNVLLHMLAIRVQGSLREGGKVLHPAMHAMIVHPSHFDDADTDHNGESALAWRCLLCFVGCGWMPPPT